MCFLVSPLIFNTQQQGKFAADQWITINMDGNPKGGLQREFGKLNKTLPTRANGRHRAKPEKVYALG